MGEIPWENGQGIHQQLMNSSGQWLCMCFVKNINHDKSCINLVKSY